jgi:hypothetical protein
MPSPEASRLNLERARIYWRAPRPWRSKQETRIVRNLAWQWFMGREPRCSGRAIARKLGVSHTYIQKLRREFAANPTAMLEKVSRLVRLPGRAMVSANGRMLLPEYRQYTTFEELAQAQRQTLRMAEQGLLRGLYRETILRVTRAAKVRSDFGLRP